LSLLIMVAKENNVPSLQDSLNIIDTEDIFFVIGRSSLSEVADFFVHHFDSYQNLFDRFCKKVLSEKLIEVTKNYRLTEINRFVDALAQIPKIGIQLSSQALTILFHRDVLLPVIEDTNFAGAKSLVEVVERVDFTSTAIQKTIEIAPVRGIRFLFSFSDLAPIRKALENNDIGRELSLSAPYELLVFIRELYKHDRRLYFKYLDVIKNFDWKEKCKIETQGNIARFLLLLVEQGITEDYLKNIYSEVSTYLLNQEEITLGSILLRGALSSINESYLDRPSLSMHVATFSKAKFRFEVLGLLHRNDVKILSLYILGLKTMDKNGYDIASSCLDLWGIADVLSDYLDERLDPKSDHEQLYVVIVHRALRWLGELVFDETMSQIDKLYKLVVSKTSS
jgi:hypothetical protein